MGEEPPRDGEMEPQSTSATLDAPQSSLPHDVWLRAAPVRRTSPQQQVLLAPVQRRGLVIASLICGSLGCALAVVAYIQSFRLAREPISVVFITELALASMAGIAGVALARRVPVQRGLIIVGIVTSVMAVMLTLAILIEYFYFKPLIKSFFQWLTFPSDD